MENHRSVEDRERILAICRAALDESPFSLDKRTLLGQILHELGRTEEARHELELVEHLLQQGTSAYRLLAEMEKKEGRLRQAARRCLQGLALDSRNDRCWSYLREINADLANALQHVFRLLDQVQDEVSESQAPQVETEIRGTDQILATLDGWMENINRIKSKRDTGADS